ncbi:Lrp/AsnC family transcriptional regulator [Pseudooceanicola sp. LIPI14-2-Ac024]|uniref:Lrp/AsnC family transcriptional regulator n=1 Tax=Pseudooceanicola sp. LIPI14-2-Ac024 TaxID=3344875 RepID=UPI0035CEEC3C
MTEIDETDRRILRVLQSDASLSQREVADRVGLSQNACWRRLTRLREAGLLGQTLKLAPEDVGFSLTVIVMIRTRHHSTGWLTQFRTHVRSIPNVIDFYRIAGDYDYLLKIVAQDMNDYDRIYRRLIDKVEIDSVTSYITMEAIAAGRNLPV